MKFFFLTDWCKISKIWNIYLTLKAANIGKESAKEDLFSTNLESDEPVAAITTKVVDEVQHKNGEDAHSVGK